jgi:hypothetical protein
MPTEQEELRLTVTLADNASAGLAKLNEEIKQLGSGTSQQHVEKFKRETQDLTRNVKQMGGEVTEAYKGLGMLRAGLAAGAAGLSLFGLEIARQTKMIVDYADKIRSLNQQARQIGVNPQELKSVTEQMKAFGISSEEAASSIAAVQGKIAELQRRGSALRADMMAHAPDRQSRANMEAYLDRLARAQTLADQLNVIREGGENVYRNTLERTHSEQRAAAARNEFWAKQGYNAKLAEAGALEKLSEEEKRIAKERGDRAEAFSNQIGRMRKTIDDLVETSNQPMLQNMKAVLDWAEPKLQKLKEFLEWMQKNDVQIEPDAKIQPLPPDQGAQGWLRRFGDWWRGPEKSMDELRKSIDEQKETIKQLNDAIKGGPGSYQPTGFGGGSPFGGAVIPAAFHPGGGVRPRGFGGGGYANLGQSVGGTPYGSSVGAGTGAGAGSTPAVGGGGGGAPAAGGGGGAPTGGTPNTKGPMTLGKGDDPRGLEQYIREAAKANGVDPDTAVRVAKSEGLRDFLGDRGKSGGAFQLYTGGGLGNEFQKETGLNPLDPKNEKATINWAMKKVVQTGWGPWHGAKRVGVGPREGLPGGTPPNGQTAGPGGGKGAGETPAAGTAARGDLPPRVQAVGGEDPKAFITHHTGGRGTVAGVQNTLRQRGLGVQYVMDREGNIVQTGGPGAAHMRSGWGQGQGLSNRNVIGMEIIARDDKDVTPAQAAAYARFMAERYPDTPIYGHGEVNPGHKEADEGLTAKRAALAERARRQLDRTQATATKVEGTGKISVNVNAPKGTNVGAEGGGLFKNVEINRQTQMSEAKRGPTGGYATAQFLQ